MRGPMVMTLATSETPRQIKVEVILQFKSKRRYQYWCPQCVSTIAFNRYTPVSERSTITFNRYTQVSERSESHIIYIILGTKNINGPKLTLTIPEGNEKENCKSNE